MTSLSPVATLALVVVSLATTGCIGPRQPMPPSIGRVPSAGGDRTTGSADQPSRPAVTRKRVASKRDASVLIADDGTTCIVNDKRYRETTVGEEVWCVWVAGD